MGISVPDILFEDYSKKDVPYAYQFLSKLKGRDLDLVIKDLSDEQLVKIAKEISMIIDKTKTISNNGRFGVAWGDFTEFSDSWTERMKIWVDETIKRGAPTGIMNDKLKSILENLIDDYKNYFDQVKSTTYLSDISSKNVMVDNGVFSGVVDLDGMTQGDPLELLGRIKASWPGTHYGEFYANSIMDEQKLSEEQRKIVLVYALINRISWACENGIKFNQNTSGIVDEDRKARDRDVIEILYKEYKEF